MGLEDEGLMERPREERVVKTPNVEVRDSSDKVRGNELVREEERVPGILYRVEVGKETHRVAYTPEGRRVDFDVATPSEAMVEAQMRYEEMYPEIGRALGRGENRDEKVEEGGGDNLVDKADEVTDMEGETGEDRDKYLIADRGKRNTREMVGDKNNNLEKYIGRDNREQVEVVNVKNKLREEIYLDGGEKRAGLMDLAEAGNNLVGGSDSAREEYQEVKTGSLRLVKHDSAVDVEEDVKGNLEAVKYQHCSNKKCGRQNVEVIEGKHCGLCSGELVTSEMPVLHLRRNLNQKYSADEGRPMLRVNPTTGDLEYVAKPINRNRSALDVVLEDFGKGMGKVGRGLKGAGKVGFKTITYPTVGNLSRNLQERLEARVGKDWYDGVRATDISRRINMFLHTFGGGSAVVYLDQSINPDTPIGVSFASVGLFGGLIPGILCLIEGINRGNGEGGGFFSSQITEPRASAIGKVVSLPIEFGLWGYDKAKNYVESVKERTNGKDGGFG